MKYLLFVLLLGGCMAQPVQVKVCHESCGVTGMKEVSFSKCECK